MLTDNKKKEELRKEIGKILKHEVSERLSADRCKTCKQIDDLFALCESIRAEALKEVDSNIRDILLVEKTSNQDWQIAIKKWEAVLAKLSKEK